MFINPSLVISACLNPVERKVFINRTRVGEGIAPAPFKAHSQTISTRFPSSINRLIGGFCPDRVSYFLQAYVARIPDEYPVSGMPCNYAYAKSNHGRKWQRSTLQARRQVSPLSFPELYDNGNHDYAALAGQSSLAWYLCSLSPSYFVSVLLYRERPKCSLTPSTYDYFIIRFIIRNIQY